MLNCCEEYVVAGARRKKRLYIPTVSCGRRVRETSPASTTEELSCLPPISTVKRRSCLEAA